MQQTISGSDGRYFYAVPQTQSEIELAHKGTVPFFCFRQLHGSFMFDLCLIVPNQLQLENFRIFEYSEVVTHNDKPTGEIEKGYSLSCSDWVGENLMRWLADSPSVRTCPLLIPISELPFDMGLLIQLIEKMPTFQTAMSQIIPQIELAEYEYVNN